MFWVEERCWGRDLIEVGGVEDSFFDGDGVFGSFLEGYVVMCSLVWVIEWMVGNDIILRVEISSIVEGFKDLRMIKNKYV